MKRDFRRCEVFFCDRLAGILEEHSYGFRFTYDDTYRSTGSSIGAAFPVTEKVVEFPELPPLFDNLVSEGWMRRTQSMNQKISESDRFGLLIHNGSDLIGAITVRPLNND